MVRILHSVSNMDRAGAETMLMNYYRHMDRTEIQFDFLCNKSKPGDYDEEILSMGGRIYRGPGLNPVKYRNYLSFMRELIGKNRYRIIEVHNGPLGVYALNAAKRAGVPVRIMHAHGSHLTVDAKYPIKWVCRRMIPGNITHRFSCGDAASAFYFGKTAAETKDYYLIRNAIELDRFVFNSEIRERLRKEYRL